MIYQKVIELGVVQAELIPGHQPSGQVALTLCNGSPVWCKALGHSLIIPSLPLPLQQCCPIELSMMTEMFYSSADQYGNH
jgi:hypothetical protein